MPVTEVAEKSPAINLAIREIKKELQKYAYGGVEVELVSDSKAIAYMDEEDIPSIIGKGGKRIDNIEKRLGIRIDIRAKNKNGIFPLVERSKKYVILRLKELSGSTVVYSGENYLFTTTVGKKGEIKIAKDSDISYKILENPSMVNVRLKI